MPETRTSWVTPNVEGWLALKPTVSEPTLAPPVRLMLSPVAVLTTTTAVPTGPELPFWSVAVTCTK